MKKKMSYIKMKQSHNPGTAKSSLNLTSKNNSVSKMKKISKYFTKTTEHEENSSLECNLNQQLLPSGSSELPNKNCLNVIRNMTNLNDSTGDMDDFEVSASVKKISKIVCSKPPPKKTKKLRKKQNSQTSLKKYMEDNFKYTDVNPEHLQIALTLSKSDQAENLETPNTKINSFKETLEQFGFGYNNKNKIESENRKNCSEGILKKNKKSRYRYITPILKVRSSEERQSVISNKISLILNQNKNNLNSECQQYSFLFCESLLKYHKSVIVKLNNLTLHELNSNKNIFYVSYIGMDQSHSDCGVLLKDWKSIPGREISPVPKYKIDNRSISPDLFDSEEEYEISDKTNVQSSNNKKKETNTPNEIFNTTESMSEMNINDCKFTDFKQNIENECVELFSPSSDEIKMNSCFKLNEVEERLSDTFTADSKTQITEGEDVLEITETFKVDDWNLYQENINEEFCANEEVEEYSFEQISQHRKIDNNEENSNSNQKIDTESFRISDDELNYSSIFASDGNKINMMTCDNSKSDITTEGCDTLFSPHKVLQQFSFDASLGDKNISEIQKQTVESENNSSQQMNRTPNNDFLIKTSNITPMPDYHSMDTPKVRRELLKFGLKPLKRQRGAQLLQYIYETTHPTVDSSEYEDDVNPMKKIKYDKNCDKLKIVENVENDLIFEKTQSKRIPSCSIPLHIVWHNFINSNPSIEESILLYEPLYLEVLHSMLKEQGFKFSIQDLTTFLDRKCITIRTLQGQRIKKKII